MASGGGWPTPLSLNLSRYPWAGHTRGIRNENEWDGYSLSWRFLVYTFYSNILQQFAVQTYLVQLGCTSKLCTTHALFAGHAGNSAQKHSNGSASRDEPWCHGEPLKSTDLPFFWSEKGIQIPSRALCAQNMWRKAAGKQVLERYESYLVKTLTFNPHHVQQSITGEV